MPPTQHIRRRCWRIMAPRWAFDPLSGAGAARNGGRFNPPGVSALYLSEDLATAAAEYGQDLPTRPGTFCAYRIDIAGMLDLTDPEVQASLDISDGILSSPWKRLALIDQTVPPTWALSRSLIDRQYPGIRVRSIQRPEGRNIILWRWNSGADDRVEYFDPNGDLPTDQDSWPA